MSEKAHEAWEVSLAFLQDHRKIATNGVNCNGCGHEARWPIEELIAQHKPWTTVNDLPSRWKCSRCGTRLNLEPLRGGHRS